MAISIGFGTDTETCWGYILNQSDTTKIYPITGMIVYTKEVNANTHHLWVWIRVDTSQTHNKSNGTVTTSKTFTSGLATPIKDAFWQGFSGAANSNNSNLVHDKITKNNEIEAVDQSSGTEKAVEIHQYIDPAKQTSTAVSRGTYDVTAKPVVSPPDTEACGCVNGQNPTPCEDRHSIYVNIADKNFDSQGRGKAYKITNILLEKTDSPTSPAMWCSLIIDGSTTVVDNFPTTSQGPLDFELPSGITVDQFRWDMMPECDGNTDMINDVQIKTNELALEDQHTGTPAAIAIRHWLNVNSVP
jgi:hypothetical protein